MKYNKLTDLPGVGKAVARDYVGLGINTPAELKDRDPERLYAELCAMQGHQVDRCMLYTFRCAHYAVNHPSKDPKTILWWNFKDV